MPASGFGDGDAALRPDPGRFGARVAEAAGSDRREQPRRARRCAGVGDVAHHVGEQVGRAEGEEPHTTGGVERHDHEVGDGLAGAGEVEVRPLAELGRPAGQGLDIAASGRLGCGHVQHHRGGAACRHAPPTTNLHVDEAARGHHAGGCAEPGSGVEDAGRREADEAPLPRRRVLDEVPEHVGDHVGPREVVHRDLAVGPDRHDDEVGDGLAGTVDVEVRRPGDDAPGVRVDLHVAAAHRLGGGHVQDHGGDAGRRHAAPAEGRQLHHVERLDLPRRAPPAPSGCRRAGTA